MFNSNINNLVSIGIATKNRWDDLHLTLTKLVEAGLESLPIIIIDDASDTPCPYDLNSFPFTQLELQTSANSQGYIYRRNQIAVQIKTKYYLSLDDDSYPVAGDLAQAIAFAETQDNLLCLSFPIYNPVQQQYENKSQQTRPYRVRSFIGCGHLLHRDRFLKLGGYRSELIHQGEEMELSARGFQQDLVCYHYPDLLIHHTASNQGRNWWRMDFYGSRNNVLWNDWFVPQRLKIVKQIRTLVSRLLIALRVRRSGLIQGEIAGFRQINLYKRNRQNMSSSYFKQWQNLPQS
ncbi:MAG: glycosyltransferase family A protein [Cyanobacteria bacterium J06623_7]